MANRILCIVVFLTLVKCIAAQQTIFDSLKNEISSSKNDTIQLLLLEKIANEYSEINPDSAYHYALKILVIARKLNLKLEEVVGLGEMGYALLNLGNFPRSLQTLLSAISIAEDPKIEKNVLPVHLPATDDFTDRTVSARSQRLTKLSRILQSAGLLYGNSGNYEKAVYYFKLAIPLAEQSNNLRILNIINTTLGRTYFSLHKLDSALLCLQRASDYTIQADYPRYRGSILLNMGRVYLAMKLPHRAMEFFLKALEESTTHGYLRGVVASHLALADLYKQSGEVDSSLHHIQEGLTVAYTLNSPDLFLRSYTALAEYYKQAGKNDSTVKYQSLIIALNESLFNSKQAQQFQNIDFDAQQRQQDILAAKKEYQNRFQKYLLLGVLAIFLMVALFLWRSNRQRQKTNALLHQHNKEIEIAMANLKTTQAQLIQSEKMASLGELTAGIAHEIQNPLNFVNNFSEINTELIEELKRQRARPARQPGPEGTGTTGSDGSRGERIEAQEEEILKVIAENELKITQHGKRADAIVKGMLLHSQKSSGIKEPTDINNLAEEYLRLAYHGFRAKNQNFTAELNLDLDPTLPLVHIIGRVLLNLYNNAFWALSSVALAKEGALSSVALAKEGAAHERLKARPDDRVGRGEKVKGEKEFQPVVKLSTKSYDNKIEIRIKDNGPGIPPNIIDKIFQPFFTTKPTGQGTGLGLSLAYDIIKAHSGEIQVDSIENSGTEFIIRLPI